MLSVEAISMCWCAVLTWFWVEALVLHARSVIAVIADFWLAAFCLGLTIAHGVRWVALQ